MVSRFHRVHDAMLDMILKNDLACIVDRGFDRRKLDQDFTAVPAVLHHPLDGFQMSDGAAQSVEHRLRIGVRMGMAVMSVMAVRGPVTGMRMGMLRYLSVRSCMNMRMCMICLLYTSNPGHPD